MATLGQRVEVQMTTGRYYEGVITSIVSGSTVDVVLFSDGDTWPDVGYGTYDAGIGAKLFTSLSTGTGVLEWHAVNPESYADAGTVSSSIATAITAALAVPGSGASAGLTLGGAGVQLSTTRPVLLMVRGTASMTSTLAGGQGFTVELRSDSNSTPTAVVDDATGSLTQTLGISVTLTDLDAWKLGAVVLAGDRVRVVQSAGAATVALTGSRMWVL
jgi:hypothetical protein